MSSASPRLSRFATIVAIVLVVSIAAVPAVGACCAKTSKGATTMHALMPCCAKTCELTSDSTRSDNIYTITTAPQLVAQVAPVTDVALPAPAPVDAVVSVLPVAGVAPPPFLSHHQFRI